jgi:hypothetical protein
MVDGVDAKAGKGDVQMSRRRTDMKARTLIGGMLALLWLTALPAWATQYRLQVANIDDQVFASYEGKASSFWSQKEPMGRLEARLDDHHFSRAAMPRHPQCPANPASFL